MPANNIVDFLRQQQAQAGGAPQQPAAAGLPTSAAQPAPDTSSGVGATAMLTPQNGAGNEMSAKVHARIALDILQSAVQNLPPDSPISKRIRSIAMLLARTIGIGSMDATQALVPEQIRMMNAALPQTGNVTPGQQAAQSSSAAQQPQPPQPV